MLNSIQLDQTLTKKEYKAAMEQLVPELSRLQREIRDAGIPVTILFEGIDKAGKGVLINELISAMDPRGYQVLATGQMTDSEKRHPFLWKYWHELPARGRIHILDHSWYLKAIQKSFDKTISAPELSALQKEIVGFEQGLTQDGMIIIKFFLMISHKEQKKRIEKLLAQKETAWRVPKEELEHSKHYDRFSEICQGMLTQTESNFAPWTIIEATDRYFAAVKIMQHVVKILTSGLAQYKQNSSQLPNARCEKSSLTTSILAGADLTQTLTREEYEVRMKKAQKKLKKLHNEIYQKQIPVVLVFEGQDAAGKGGAIKRLTKKLDPRGYEVIPTSAPNAVERQYHYLWRFWNKMPKDGHIAIFDRSWYGRVMVERIEGFCSEQEWKRAYEELNEMEASLTAHGTVVLKFWLQIDKDEQEVRFKERMENPLKQWKITEEDWRNREKWDQYQIAVDEMLLKTSTSQAPWIIVEANDKLFARVKVLETVADALEKAVR